MCWNNLAVALGESVTVTKQVGMSEFFCGLFVQSILWVNLWWCKYASREGMFFASLDGLAPRHRKGRIVSNGESNDCFIFNARALARDVILIFDAGVSAPLVSLQSPTTCGGGTCYLKSFIPSIGYMF